MTTTSPWLLSPHVDFLNHGSFGALPRAVYDAQDAWRRRIEADPIELLGRQAPTLIDDAKRPVGEFLAMSPDDFGLVTNATEGINAVLHSLSFGPGDELLTTTHVYNAVRQAMRQTAYRQGAAYREIGIPTPLFSSRQIIDRIAGELSDRTRLLVLDHVTSPTAIVFPVAEIASLCAARNIELLIDGAHAPGMLDLNVPATGATYYAGNLHKWVCAPKGCAFLWVARHRQAAIHPAVISHNLCKGLAKEFEWQGTRDLSAWLAAPAAIEFLAQFGWPRVRKQNHDLATWAHRLLCDRWNVEPLSPLDGSLLGSMATIPLPAPLASMTEPQAQRLQQSLYSDHRLELPVIPWQNRWHLRVSCQVYNTQSQYNRLAATIPTLRP